jgi:hypothetical protein
MVTTNVVCITQAKSIPSGSVVSTGSGTPGFRHWGR